ncbi:MAG: MarR family transcriptional regulator [Thermoleophilia bacterium]
MNPETTTPEEHRSSLARMAAEAVLAMASSVERDLDRHAADFGISDAKLEVLEVLSCCSGRRACLYALGDRLGVTRPNITKLVDGLERQGLVERRPHPDDRRMVHAQLTPEGAAIASRALPGRVQRLEELWSQLDDEELEVLVGLLMRTAVRTCGETAAQTA